MRRFLPALVAVAVHTALLAGFLALRPTARAPEPETVLPIAWIDPAPAPLPPPSRAGSGLRLPAPSLAITVPEIPALNAPTSGLPGLPGMLGEFVGCGLGLALTEEERARCEKLRTELYALPAAQPGGDETLGLEQRFARDKALQDHPFLHVCYRRMGPDPLCFSRGFEVLYGSAAARDSIPLAMGDPLKPR